MSTQPLHYQNVVLNAIAGAGDAVLAGGHILRITDCPDMDIRTLNVPLGTFAPSLVSNPSSFEVTWAVANSTFYQVRINQTFVGQGATTEIFEFTSDTTATDIEISDAFRAMIALNQNLSVTMNATGSATLQVTADGVNSALLTITVVTANGTVASLLSSTAIVSSTNATPIVVTVGAIPADVVVGSTVTIAGHLVNTAANGTWRVSAVAGGTDITLEGSVGNGVGGATGTVDSVAQFQRGQGQQLIDAGVTDAVAGNTYTTWTFQPTDVDPTASQGSEIAAVNQLTLYLNEGDANFAALQAQLVSLLQTAGVIA